MNVGAFGNSVAINNLVEGLTTTLLGRGQAAPAESLSIALSRLTMLIPLLIAVLWVVWSYRSLWGWWLYAALAIDFCVIGVIWLVVPARFQTPMATIALFAPDEFALLITIPLSPLAARSAVASWLSGLVN